MAFYTRQLKMWRSIVLTSLQQIKKDLSWHELGINKQSFLGTISCFRESAHLPVCCPKLDAGMRADPISVQGSFGRFGSLWISFERIKGCGAVDECSQVGRVGCKRGIARGQCLQRPSHSKIQRTQIRLRSVF
jgi:hypothetical protein